ncbi:hypothetical protein G6F57_004611 [Rhizopus arrhizus]|uniref:Uncharacterized protein n=1 Tax=Rhizopus oryzae TaxID=64495 RepID=A0A9P6XBD8_RHIOR|nr:hypothetical protein G6F23_001141 [Rhizopus arrhizus]KAG1425579.1 hypothetical protein G6F58_001861 [Rhizopus delemar]KAG0766027.1 hypothetical protein G6F24_003938 [Rhizopus arrhizus]KAG0788276.1 hypothetical protein G6F22_007056 [Rhizopus arrhizus]KAG0791112.1 hypothetical protein G6F21_005321 [Rhizopus arrhizus]
MKNISNDDEEVVFDFLENIARVCHNIYSGKQGLEQGEATFNDLLIFPSLKAIAKAIVEYDDNSEAGFKVGKVPLKQ